MAATSFSRSRSPVMSIRTQPEDENALRAELKAASRTQHEILPRYSWPTTILRKDVPGTLKLPYRPIVQRNPPSQQLTRSSAVDDEQTYEFSTLPPQDTYHQASTLPQASAEMKKSWVQLTRRKSKANPTHYTTPTTNVAQVTSLNQGKRSRRTKASARLFRQGGEKPINEVETTQPTQVDFAPNENVEELNTLSDLSSPQPLKGKRTVRKSMYGSLSSTKNFFRQASKGPLERLCNRGTPDGSTTPHVWSFENKDHLREYLNPDMVTSPVSPYEHCQARYDDKEPEPAELSAGELPIELEGNSPDRVAQIDSATLRTSSPSIPDLPPYIDDKHFRDDMAKEQRAQGNSNNIDSTGGLKCSWETSYICTFCQESVSGDEVYDFCSTCNPGRRVICTNCAEKDLSCRHEPEDNFQSSAFRRVTSVSQQERAPDGEHESTLSTRVSTPSTSQASRKSDFTTLCGDQSLPRPVGTLPSSTSSSLSSCRQTSAQSTSTQQKFETDLQNIQSELIREMSYLRREQDLVYRERELSLRAREIEVRDQQSTLREREAIVQQKSDSLVNKLEALVSCQEFVKASGNDAQSQTQTKKSANLESQASEVFNDEISKAVKEPLLSPQQPECCASQLDGLSEVITGTESSTQDFLDYDANVKSYGAAQKRRKDGSSSSTSSTPAASSSPEQPNKTISRGNSERSASQDEDDEDEADRPSPKKSKQGSSTTQLPQRLFACPYAKNDPVRFSSRNMQEKNYRGCGTHYLPDVSRLKQHLKRVHWQPETYCPRCWNEFDDSARLTEHARADVACKKSDCPFPEKMDKTQQDRIHVKRPRVPPATVWFDIYRVLFPGSPLPESPYVEDDPIITPVSANPASDVNKQATQLLSDKFNHLLNQHEELNAFRDVIGQALQESFNNLLCAFSLSPTASPGAGPSIVVSPVSRTPSDTTRPLDSSPIMSSRPAAPERRRSVTDIVTQPQKVPRLQQPRPRSKPNPALEVPHDHHRSSLSYKRTDSSGNSSLAEHIFNISIPSHVLEDTGYDDESRSFEMGDDQEAMKPIQEPTLPSHRHKNKSVMSIDSGYGSNKSERNQHPPTFAPLNVAPMPQNPHNEDAFTAQGYFSTSCEQYQAIPMPDDPFNQFDPLAYQHVLHDQHLNNNSSYYYDYLDPMSQDMLNEFEPALSGSSNVWSLP